MRSIDIFNQRSSNQARCLTINKAAPGSNISLVSLPSKPHAQSMVRFIIPVADNHTSADDVLECPMIDSILTAQESPLCHSEIFSEDFTDPFDRVALNSLRTELG
jgi:hypothetical protein